MGGKKRKSINERGRFSRGASEGEEIRMRNRLVNLWRRDLRIRRKG